MAVERAKVLAVFDMVEKKLDGGKGWIKGQSHKVVNYKNCFCLFGAITHCRYEFHAAASMVIYFVQQAINEAYGQCVYMTTANDATPTTFTDIQAWLDRGRELATHSAQLI